jgi:hypothetical protein
MIERGAVCQNPVHRPDHKLIISCASAESDGTKSREMDVH